MYLFAIMDWYSRKILAWELSNTLDTEFCLKCLKQVLKSSGIPEIMNTQIINDETAVKTTTKICVVANGCHENYNDAVLLERYMADTNNVVICDNYIEADLICLLGCANTLHMETESKELKEHIQATKRPDSRLLVMGCLAKIRPDLGSDQEELNSSLGQINPEALSFRDIEASLSAHSLYCDTIPRSRTSKPQGKKDFLPKS